MRRGGDLLRYSLMCIFACLHVVAWPEKAGLWKLCNSLHGITHLRAELPWLGIFPSPSSVLVFVVIGEKSRDVSFHENVRLQLGVLGAAGEPRTPFQALNSALPKKGKGAYINDVHYVGGKNKTKRRM